MEQFVAIHNNKFIGSITKNLDRIVLSFYVEEITEKTQQTKDIYIILQGQKLHEYHQLDEIQENNPLNIYGYNSMEKYKTQFLNVRTIMERDKKNDIEQRIKNCQWNPEDLYKNSGQNLPDFTQKIFDDVC